MAGCVSSSGSSAVKEKENTIRETRINNSVFILSCAYLTVLGNHFLK